MTKPITTITQHVNTSHFDDSKGYDKVSSALTQLCTTLTEIRSMTLQGGAGSRRTVTRLIDTLID